MGNLVVYKSKDELLAKAKTAIGHTIGEYNVNNRNLTFSNKGVIGQIIEEGLFGYEINSRAEPDFAKLGVELKVTGLKKLKDNSLVAKERLVLNIIDYFKEADSDFLNSSFWRKNKSLLLMFYYYQDQIPPEQYRILDSLLYEYPDEDLKIIMDDWLYINKMIREGKAHLISEADTFYLAACTKGANGEAVRIQPYSKELAKQRAFCLKASYINNIINKYLGGFNVNNIFVYDEIKDRTFDSAVLVTCKPYIGKTEKELRNMFSLSESNPKNIFELLSARMLDIKGKINDCDEFRKANVNAKFIRVEENGRVVESMSFPNFKFTEIVNQEWENSDLRNMFYETKYIFFVFAKKDGDYCFSKVLFWNMPIEILDTEVKSVWEKTKNVIKEGNIVQYISKPNKSGKCLVKTNFPGMKENKVCHVRPHARDASDTYPLPVPDKITGQLSYTKQCFWLGNDYIKEIIKNG